jgi:hypothetical protein
MKHFSTHPLSFLANATPSSSYFAEGGSTVWLEYLIHRLPPMEDSVDRTLETTLRAVDRAREGFRRKLNQNRLGLKLLRSVKRFLTQSGHKSVMDRVSESPLSILQSPEETLSLAEECLKSG